MEAKIDTSQLKILEDFFEGLSSVDQTKVFMASFRRAAKPLIAAAKATAPRRTGNLMRSIGAIGMPKEIAIMVGAKLPKGWHGHIVEGGTGERFRRKSGGATGRMPASHFFETAYNATEKQMYESIEKEWYEEIDKFIIKANRRAKK